MQNPGRPHLAHTVVRGPIPEEWLDIPLPRRGPSRHFRSAWADADMVVPHTVPRAPPSLRTPSSDTQFTLTGREPASDSGAAIIDHRIQVGPREDKGLTCAAE